MIGDRIDNDIVPAKQLGMKNTKFMNCCGLDDGLTEGQHYSSAYDIALMSRELLNKHKEIKEKGYQNGYE